MDVFSLLACFWSHSSFPIHIAPNMVRMLVNMVALDRIHSPNEREKTSSSIRRIQGPKAEFIIIGVQAVYGVPVEPPAAPLVAAATSAAVLGARPPNPPGCFDGHHSTPPLR